MIIILKSEENGEFFVRQTSNNNEPLNASETEKKKQNCWKNIAAAAHNFNGNDFIVRDETGKKPVDYSVQIDGQGKLLKTKIDDTTPSDN